VNATGFFTNQDADIVIGQQNMTRSQANQANQCAANTLYAPYGVISDGTRLVISDNLNHRVLIFNTLPNNHNASADIVIGQKDMWSNKLNQGAAISAKTLSYPRGVYLVGNRLFIADTGNNRVLIFSTFPNTHNASADVVIGQKDMWSNEVNQGTGCNANTLYQPHDIFSDGTHFFVGDTLNHRVCIFNSIPVINNVSADIVLGQNGMTNNLENQGGGVRCQWNVLALCYWYYWV